MQNIIRYMEGLKKFNDVNLIRQALESLNLEIDPSKVIVVAGTNGKGTTCATLQTLLMKSGKIVGFSSSPHLIKINERIKFNCEDISDEEFCEVFHRTHERIQGFELSYFEYLTLMSAYYFFKVKNVDFAIFEVGLGGTLDAANVIPHDLSTITKLGMDHEEKLGGSPLKIAENKFGIISSGNKVFHTKFDDNEIAELARETARKHNAELIEAYPCDCLVDTSSKYPIFQIKTRWGIFPMSMQGKRAAENTALAITICDRLIGNVERVLPALGKVYWPGRMEKVEYKNRDVFLSGDHNPQGIESLLEIVKFYNFQNVRFIVGICKDKNRSEMLEKILSIKKSYLYLTETPVKTFPLEEHEETFLKRAKFASSDPIAAMNAAISDADKDDLIIVTGSLYLVGKIKKEKIMKKLSTIGFCISVLIGGDLLAMERIGSFDEGSAPAMADVDGDAPWADVEEGEDAIRALVGDRFAAAAQLTAALPINYDAVLIDAAGGLNPRTVLNISFRRDVSEEAFQRAIWCAVTREDLLSVAALLVGRSGEKPSGFISAFIPDPL